MPIQIGKRRIKLFTDRDMDGFGCRIIGERYYNSATSTLETQHEDIRTINNAIHGFIHANWVNDFDQVFITDLSVDMQNAELIDLINREAGYDKIVLIDHHKTALWLNTYKWANVLVEQPTLKGDDGRVPLASGTSLFLEYIKSTDVYRGLTTREEVFSEMVRKYDTWEWHNVYDDITPKKLNDLFNLYGGERFVRHINYYLQRIHSGIFGNTEHLMLELERERIDKYIKEKQANIVIREINGFKVALVAADTYLSELGNTICKENPETVEIAAMVDTTRMTVSFRTAKDGIDVGAFAANYGGGGHAKAAGCGLSSKAYIEFLETAFN